MPKYAGPYVPMPSEVIQLLRPYSAACSKDYLLMLDLFFLEHDATVEGEWVVGRINATLDQVARKIEVGRGWFLKKIWPTWKEVGIAKQSGYGQIELPMLYKKSDVYQMPLPVRNAFNELREEIQELRQQIRNAESAEDVEIVEPGASGKRAAILTVLDKDSDQRGKEAAAAVPGTQKIKEIPGSREWILKMVEKLWPGKPYRQETEADYIDEMEQYSAVELEAAFKRARDDKAKYGNYQYLLNYLRNPKLYDSKDESTAKGERVKAKAKRSKNIGGLDADWLKTDEEGE